MPFAIPSYGARRRFARYGGKARAHSADRTAASGRHPAGAARRSCVVWPPSIFLTVAYPMSDAKPPSDLSMDEVLATIRRIIAEDEQSTSSGAAGGSGRPGPAAAASDDVLELTEALNEDGTVRHLAPIGSTSRPAERLREPPPPAASEKPEPEARPEPLLPREEPSLSPPSQ